MSSKPRKICSNCGCEIESRAKICYYCGAEQSSNSRKGKRLLDKRWCRNCGAEIDVRAYVCPKCGVRTWQLPDIEPVSDWWYLVPIFFGIIGGLIAYVAAKDDDPYMAKNLLIVGIVSSFIAIVCFIFYYHWIMSLLQRMIR